jgi:hypothetical protein
LSEVALQVKLSSLVLTSCAQTSVLFMFLWRATDGSSLKQHQVIKLTIRLFFFPEETKKDPLFKIYSWTVGAKYHYSVLITNHSDDDNTGDRLKLQSPLF